MVTIRGRKDKTLDLYRLEAGIEIPGEAYIFTRKMSLKKLNCQQKKMLSRKLDLYLALG